MILAKHYDVPEKDLYTEAFQNEQDEIICCLNDMGFQERNDIDGLIKSDVVVAVTTDPIPSTRASSLGSPREEFDSSTEQ